MGLIPGLSLRAPPEEEEAGLDEAQLGEFAYDYVEMIRDPEAVVFGEAKAVNFTSKDRGETVYNGGGAAYSSGEAVYSSGEAVYSSGETAYGSGGATYNGGESGRASMEIGLMPVNLREEA